MKHPLEEIPGVGPRIAGVMEKLSIPSICSGVLISSREGTK